MLLALSVLVFNMLMIACVLALAPDTSPHITVMQHRDFWL